MRLIPMKELSLCPIQLRPVKQETLEYLELRNSIRQYGILQPILVRTGRANRGYEVILGFHRFTVAKGDRMNLVPCIVKELTDKEILTAQITENKLRVNTSNTDIARRLWRIIELEKSMTLPELASSLNKNVDWVRRMLMLIKLCPEAESLLNENQLSLGLAMELAKLPYKDQLNLLSVTGGVPNGEAIELARQKARHFRQRSKDERVALKQQDTIEIAPIFRTRKEILTEMDCPTMMASVLESSKATTPIQIWRAALSYVTQLDPQTREKRISKLTLGEENE